MFVRLADGPPLKQMLEKIDLSQYGKIHLERVRAEVFIQDFE